MSDFSWPIFVGAQILFWIGFAAGYDIRKQDESEAGND